MRFLKVISYFWDLLSPILGKNVLAVVDRLFFACNLQCCKTWIKSELYYLPGKFFCQLAVELYISIFVKCDLKRGLWGG